MLQKKISVLGSTGSVGLSTLDVCRQHPDKFKVVGLAAGRNLDVLLKQVLEFKPELVSVQSEKSYHELLPNIPKTTALQWGAEGVDNVATLPAADLVVSAIVGAAGLEPTLKAIEAGKTIGLANKESMVIAGEIMSARARAKGIKILPIDSEHSAIFQCLNGEHKEDVKHLILTASGGPFLHKPESEFAKIKKEEALKHPNWDMGAKITVDSASMMNKGLEVMEAHWLFDVLVSQVKVVIHPQSVIHSMVEFVDGSVMAQMGEPDMRVPIAYALSYPRRISTNVKPLHLPEREKITFYEPDLQKFRCLKIAFDVARSGKSYAPVLNAANEIAVDGFLTDKIGFVQIGELIDRCIQKHVPHDLRSIEDVLAADQWARAFVGELVLRG